MAAVIAGAFGVAPTASAATGYQKGVSIQSRSAGDFASGSFDQSVSNAKKDGVNLIMLIVPVHQDNIYSSTVYAGGDTPTDAALASGIKYITSQGMGAGIAIHDDPYDGQWRALINPGDTVGWFNSYGAQVNHYAQLAQADGAGELVIGTELSTMTKSTNTASWQTLIKNVRGVYGGLLTYSAQHSGYMGEVSQIGFWGNLDFIGISAYYGLGNGTDQASMESAWKNWDASEIAPAAAKYNKRVVFTEVGFVSRDGATSDPGSGYTLNTGVNTALQATAYSALFDYWKNSSELAGMFIWDWSSDPNAGGSADGGYTPQNKPAEAVLKQYYSGTPGSSTGSSAPGMGGGSGPAGGTTTAPSAPTTYSAALNGSTAQAVGTAASNTVSVSTNNPLTNMLVDIEIYDAAGNRVAQTAYPNQSLSSTAQSYSVSWTPASAGTYTIKLGVFTADWASNVYWNDALGTVTVSAPAPTTPTTSSPGMGGGASTGGGSTAPTQPTTPVQPTAPSQPSTPAPLPTALDIWWPGQGVTVSGVQPFKALIDGRDPATYDLFWQVDGGQLNKMDDNANPVAHKESSVDLSGWNWNPSHNYAINFIAKDTSGNVISQKAVTITVY